MTLASSAFQAIGNTALVELRRIVPRNGAKIFVKLEFQNPTGSMKDRMALGLVECAEKDGRMSAQHTLIEYTGGTTGASLAFVCAAKGYKSHMVSSRAFSQEKLDQMVAFGAKLTLVPYDGKGIKKELILSMIEEARKLSAAPNTFWSNQLHNADSIAGYHALGEEIWQQSSGEVTAFVQSIGTAASLRGVATVLQRHNPKIKIFAAEPAESAVLSGGKPGAHDIEGIGIGYAPPLWDPSLVEEVFPVSTVEAKKMARRLSREEGIFAGTSSGGNVVAALRIAEKLGPQARVATLMVDSGLKYVTTDLYRAQSSQRSY